MLENERAETLSLNGVWQIEIGGQSGEIRVPGAWEAQGYPFNAGVNDPAVYRRSFELPADWEGAAIWLRFGAVSYSRRGLRQRDAGRGARGLVDALRIQRDAGRSPRRTQPA